MTDSSEQSFSEWLADAERWFENPEAPTWYARAVREIRRLQAESDRYRVQAEDNRQHAADWEDVATGKLSGRVKALETMKGLRAENDSLQARVASQTQEITTLEAEIVAGRRAFAAMQERIAELRQDNAWLLLDMADSSRVRPMTADSDHSSDFDRACAAYWDGRVPDRPGFWGRFRENNPEAAEMHCRGMLAALREIRKFSERHWLTHAGRASQQAMLDELIRQGEARQPGD